MTRIPLTIIGPSNYFKSGLSSYTQSLVGIFSQSPFFHVSVLFLNKFIPKVLFPGKHRSISDFSLDIPNTVPFFNGLDWFLFPSLFKSFKFLFSIEISSKQLFLLQWWTSSVLHIYLLFTLFLKRAYPQAKIILEIHEIFDPLEQRIRPLGWYVRFLLPILLRNVDICLFHSLAEVQAFSLRYYLPSNKIKIAPHIFPPRQALNSSPSTHLPSETFTILFFGLIRDYKGVPLLLQAFNEVIPQLDEQIRSRVILKIVGEIWDDKKTIFNLANNSPYRKNIQLIPRYVQDKHIPTLFSQSNLLVLPYLRGMQSGVLHLGMSYNIPIISSDVGGFKDSLSNYENKLLVPPNNLVALVQALHQMIVNQSLIQSPTDTPVFLSNSSSVNSRFLEIIRNLFYMR